MSTTTDAPAAETQTLKQRWQEFHAQNPKIRIREGAARLGTTEAQLVAAHCGDTATRLARPQAEEGWGRLIAEIPKLGRVMALTRNDDCVHERSGIYGPVEFFGHIGTILGADIDLRIFFHCWASAFAVVDPQEKGTLRSIQFFDKNGGAIHKIYLEEASDVAAYDSLVAEFKAGDQGTELEVTAKAEARAVLPDSEIDAEGFQSAWQGLQDTHDFYILLGKFRLERRQALRLAPEGCAIPLDKNAAELVLRAASERETPIMVFVGNDGMIQIHTGPVKNIVPYGEWINVIDPDFNLHLRSPAVDQAWLVRKPTRDGTVTSIELYNAKGGLVCQFFGQRKPGEPEREDWRALAASIPVAG